jgi:hypothetical protein
VSDGVAMGDQIRQVIRSSLHRAACRRAQEEGARVVVFGHTHEPVVEALPDGAVYVNSGSWTWRADFTGEGKDTWRDLFLHPERFMQDRHLSYVRVDYDAGGNPTASLQVPAPSVERVPWLVASWRRLKAWFVQLLRRFRHL